MTIAKSVAAAAAAERADVCGSCSHSPAYHDGDGGRPCRAWNPDEDDSTCACKGWKTKPPPPPPLTRLDFS